MQQAPRASDNPVIDAAILLGNSLRLPVLVYQSLREDYPYASDRLHRFILGASRDLAIGCEQRGLACVQYVDREAKREKGLIYRLATQSAAVILEDQPAFVAQWQSERFSSKTEVAVISHGLGAIRRRDMAVIRFTALSKSAPISPFASGRAGLSGSRTQHAARGRD